MSDEELAKILKEFGFEKNGGNGEVIFTDDDERGYLSAKNN